MAASRWFGSRFTRLLLLTAAQALFLLAIAASYMAVGAWGQEIRLKTEPIDPRDAMYGDYVILNYEISRLKMPLWKEGTAKPEDGQTVYVVVKPEGDIYEPVAVYGSKPAVSADQVALKGRVDYSGYDQFSVKYGLERYYVPEGTGGELEKKAGNTVVRVKVASWGQSRISEIE
ncbi:GDYXXLXY domain-containing protein [Paenibacillus thalictri]|uniref:GDYXXLXY domain-containing protein n=1 Tax=Paenibacillus thalictri TaxID=2527873 RepID=A0A4Q9DYQ0_9BACL|nr:GDYXXLXY domain-containing protein [Paenibacillus thalictri]TBL81565.1 hypothetical protein EYB31_00695 [Paenibacillus thalictri]